MVGYTVSFPQTPCYPLLWTIGAHMDALWISWGGELWPVSTVEDSVAFPQSSCLVQRWRCDLSLCPVQTKFRFPQFWLLDKSQFSSSEGALPSPLTDGTNVVPISLPMYSLACRLPPSVSQVPSSSHLPPRKLPASHSPYYPAILTMLSLDPFFCSLLVLSLSPPLTPLPCPLLLFLLPRPSLLAMFCLLLSLSLSALDSTRCLWMSPP